MIRLHALGDCAIQVDRKLIDPSAQVAFAILLYAIIESGKRLSRSRLHAMLWPRVPGTEARHRFRQAIYELKEDGAPLIVDDVYIKLAAAEVRTDFRDAVAASDAHSSVLLNDFLPGYAPAFSVEFDRWLQSARDRVHIDLRSALLSCLRGHRLHGRWRDVDATARCILRTDPLNEEATLSLAEATAMVGNKIDALDLLDQYSADMGDHATKIALPTILLRRRISDHVSSNEFSPDSPFIGRKPTYAAIGGLISRMRSSAGGGCMISGESGIGKTRLAHEISRAARLDGVGVVSIACAPTDARRPLSAVVELVHQMKAMPGAIGCSPSSIEYLKRLTGDDDIGRTIVEEDAPAFLYAAIKRSITDLLTAVAEENPVLILIDDIDQADDLSLQITKDLVAVARAQRILFVMTGRRCLSSIAHLSEGGRGITSYPLCPLDPEEALHLSTVLTAGDRDPASDDVRRRYLDLADGNPFLIHEFAHYWTRWGDNLPVPPSIQTALERRIAALSNGALRLLQTLGLLGRGGTHARLERIIRSDRSEITRSIDELHDARLIRLDGDSLRPTQEALAQIATRKLPLSESQHIHWRIATCLRRELESSQDSRALWDCVEQFRLAGQSMEAIDLLMKCSSELLRLGLPMQALAIWERASESYHADEERLRIQEALIPTLRAVGDLVRIEEAAAEAMRLRKALNVQPRPWSDWQVDVLEARMYASNDMGAVLAEASICLADEHTPLQVRVRAGVCALICAYNLTDSTSLASTYEHVQNLSAGAHLAAAEQATVELIYHSTLGDLEAGVSAGRSLVACARRSGSLTFLAQSLRRCAKALRLVGAFSEAQRILAEALALAERIDSRSYVLATNNLIAETLIEEGNLVAARDRLGACFSPGDRRCYPYRAVECALLSATIALIDGDTAAAERILNSRLVDRWRKNMARSPGRGRHHVLAVTCLLAVLRNEIPPTNDFRTLESAFIRLRGIGDQDFVAFATAKTLIAFGESDAANQLLREYLTRYRRERYRVPTYLEGLLSLRAQMGS